MSSWTLANCASAPGGQSCPGKPRPDSWEGSWGRTQQKPHVPFTGRGVLFSHQFVLLFCFFGIVFGIV